VRWQWNNYTESRLFDAVFSSNWNFNSRNPVERNKYQLNISKSTIAGTQLGSEAVGLEPKGATSEGPESLATKLPLVY
jgi:hypothetical protein